MQSGSYGADLEKRNQSAAEIMKALTFSGALGFHESPVLVSAAEGWTAWRNQMEN
jgi:hypothetical protein